MTPRTKVRSTMGPAWRMAIVVLGLELLTGCAGIEVHVVEPSKDDDAEGFRYYEPAHYLLVHSDGEGGLATQHLVLPDTSKLRSIELKHQGASSEATLEFKHGMLTSSELTGDATEIPKAIITAAKVALGAAAGLGAFALPGVVAEDIEAPPPALFRIIVKGSELLLYSGDAVGLDGKPMVIRITVPKEKKPEKEK
jgi:hypothetical protein